LVASLSAAPTRDISHSKSGRWSRRRSPMSESKSPLHPVPGWAHSSGYITVNPALPAGPSGDVVAAVQDAVARYAWAFDDRRPELFDDVFTADAVWEGLVMGEQRVGPFVGRDKILEWLTRFWRYQKDQRRHVYVNFVVDGDDGHTVTAACYMLLYGS